MISDADKLRAIESLLRHDFRRQSVEAGSHDDRIRDALKAIAQDIRGRRPVAVRGALSDLADAVNKSQFNPAGCSMYAAEMLRCHWPTVYQALRAYEGQP